MPNLDDHPAIWKLQPQTKAKHEIMRRYLGGWFPILGRWHRRVVFIDGFAGPGRYEGSEPGSPVIALNTLLGHPGRPRDCEFMFLFCEADPRRYLSLRATIDDLRLQRQPWPDKVQIEAVDQTFTAAMDEVLDNLRQQKKSLAPTFAFVDPFGVKGIEMSQISELMSFQHCELFINLATQGMARWIKTDEFEHHHDALFGTSAWRDGAELRLAERRKFLAELYRGQLRDQCGFKHTLQFEMINPDGQHSYYLIHATNHRKGVEVMKDAMWAVDPSGGFRFEARLAGQSVLFSGAALDTGPLREALTKRFGGRIAAVEEVEDYVLFETPFRTGHLKRLTLDPMEAAGEIVAVARPAGETRRKGTFPAGCRITFAG